jgi:hypothetical protein
MPHSVKTIECVNDLYFQPGTAYFTRETELILEELRIRFFSNPELFMLVDVHLARGERHTLAGKRARAIVAFLNDLRPGESRALDPRVGILPWDANGCPCHRRDFDGPRASVLLYSRGFNQPASKHVCCSTFQ